MFCRTALPLVILLSIAWVCDGAETRQRGRRSGRLRLPPPPAAQSLDQQQSLPLDQSPRSRYSYWRDIYPQFYGGFHYRQIYEFGPPGDFGFRGSPW